MLSGILPGKEIFIIFYKLEIGGISTKLGINSHSESEKYDFSGM